MLSDLRSFHSNPKVLFKPKLASLVGTSHMTGCFHFKGLYIGRFFTMNKPLKIYLFPQLPTLSMSPFQTTTHTYPSPFQNPQSPSFPFRIVFILLYPQLSVALLLLTCQFHEDKDFYFLTALSND